MTRPTTGPAVRFVSEEELKTLAKTFRDWYVARVRDHEERRTGVATNYGDARLPRWDGGPEESSGKHYTAIWPKLVRHCLRYSVDPELLISAAFARTSRLERPPLPNMLLQDALIREAQHLAEKESERLFAQLRRESEFLAKEKKALMRGKTKYTEDQALMTVLCRLSHPLSMLFRHCLAVHSGFTELARTTYAEAMREYVFKRDMYNAAWGNFIPDRLNQTAGKLRATIERIGSR